VGGQAEKRVLHAIEAGQSCGAVFQVDQGFPLFSDILNDDLQEGLISHGDAAGMDSADDLPVVAAGQDNLVVAVGLGIRLLDLFQMVGNTFRL